MELKKEHVIKAVLDAKLNMEIKEHGGKFYVNNRCFDNMDELDKYINRLENLLILIRVSEELGLDYSYDNKKLTISFE